MIKKNIAISGASGFLGKNLSNYLDKNKYNITLLTRSEKSKKEITKENILVKIINWDNIDQIKEVLKNVDIFIHAGAKLPSRGDANDYKIIRSSIKIAKNICKANLKLEKFIFISTLRTCIEIGKKNFEDNSNYNFYKYDTAYGRSKYLTEKYFLKYKKKLPLIICSPAHIIGPEEVKIAKSNEFIINYLQKKIAIYTNAKYAIIDINDVCKAIDLIISKSEINKKYLLCSHNPTFKEIIEICEKLQKNKKIKFYIPIFLLNFISWAFEILNNKFGIKKIPMNRSSYNFAKLEGNFIGNNILNLGMKYQDLTDVIAKIKKKIMQDNI